MRKDVFLGATIDRASANILATLAELEAEGNRSRLLRQLIKEAAHERGLTEELQVNVVGRRQYPSDELQQKEITT